MAHRLTKKSIEKIKPDPKRRLEIADSLSPGLRLYLIVQSSGVKSWAVRYWREGRERKATLGRYPALDISTARTRAAAIQQAVTEGRDPAKENLAIQRGGNRDVYPDVVRNFISRYARAKGNRSWPETARLLGLHRGIKDPDELYAYRGGLAERWATRGVANITRQDILEVLDEHIERGAGATANRTRTALATFFNWCLEREFVAASPCHGVRAPASENSRDRVLTDDELRWLWTAAEQQGPPFASFIHLLILTAQRRAEVAEMREAELDLIHNIWTIPADRAKNNQKHDLPLSDAVLHIISRTPRVVGDEGFLFSTTGHSPISGFSRCKDRLDASMLEFARKYHGPNISINHWTLQDVRRTAASGMAKLGIAPHVVEAVLNHKSGTIKGVAATYNRYSYSAEKRNALQRWAQHVEGLIAVM